jgi:hypothetical protein
VIPGDGLIPEKPDPEMLLQLYKISIDEYRFQVNLNWQRSQYYFVLNAALIAAGGSLLGIQGDRGRPFAAILFTVGLIAVILAVLVTRTQHTYYRSARENLKDFEQRLGLKDFGIKTTPSFGSGHKRLATVTTFNSVMFSLLGLIDLAGVLHTWQYAVSTWFN